MKCSNCGNIVKSGDSYCSKCRAKLVWKNKLDSPTATPIYTGDQSKEEILTEGKKQLGGIVILLWFLIGFLSIVLLSFLIQSCWIIFEEDLYTGLDDFLFYSVTIGGILAFFIITQLGIKNQRPYAVPFTRITLVLGCFTLVGLFVVLTIFWKRINNPYAKKYLNYFDGSLQRHLR